MIRTTIRGLRFIIRAAFSIFELLFGINIFDIALQQRIIVIRERGKYGEADCLQIPSRVLIAWRELHTAKWAGDNSGSLPVSATKMTS